MVIAALKTLTWGTVAAAVLSALLLAYAGGSFPRIASITADAVRARAAGPSRPELAGPHKTSASEAAAAAGIDRARTTH